MRILLVLIVAGAACSIGLLSKAQQRDRSAEQDARSSFELHKLEHAKSEVVASETRLRQTLLYRVVSGKPVPITADEAEIARVAASATPAQQHQADLWLERVEQQIQSKK